MSENYNQRTLMDYSPDIKVLDCTMRDGGLVNNFAFTEEFVRDLYQTNIKAGVDYMEFGYKASKDVFDPKDFGKWKFCDEKDIRAIVGDNKSPLKISVMADVGRCDYKKDILPGKDSVIDLVRVATYIHQIPAAVKMIEDIKKKGYEATVNIRNSCAQQSAACICQYDRSLPYGRMPFGCDGERYGARSGQLFLRSAA